MPEANNQAPPSAGLGHFVMTVADVGASHRFYASFGLRTMSHDGAMAILELRGGTHLLLFQKGDAADGAGGSPLDQAPARSIDLMIAGRTREDLERFRSDLVEQGVSPDPIMEQRFFGHYVFKAKDPDGAEVTVSTSHASRFPI